METEILKKRLLLVLIIIFIIACGYWIFSENSVTDIAEAPITSENEETNKAYVYLSGGVKIPGVYEVSKGTRVYEVVKKAGDTIPYANIKDIDMQESIQEDRKIHIPVDVSNATTTLKLVNINSANELELRLLPGVGKATASKIIEYRNEHGNFKTKEELKEISGIGEGKYSKLVDKVTI